MPDCIALLIIKLCIEPDPLWKMNKRKIGHGMSSDELAELHSYRLQRIKQGMQQIDIALCILCNPVSLRYAVDYRGYQLFQSHIPTAYLYVALDGPTVLHGAGYKTLDLVDHYHEATFLSPFDAGFDIRSNCRQFVSEITDYLKQNHLYEHRPRIAIERFSPLLALTMHEAGMHLLDAEALLEQARLIKSSTEIQCIKHAIQVAESGMRKMRHALVPGITEEELWSILHQVNIARGGDWIEGRMLSSGLRTNPWLQEASDKVIHAGELVAFDTDMIGPNGYCADISRTWLCPPAKPTAHQKATYQHAYDEVHYNIALLKPGMSFYDLSHQAFKRHAEYIDRRYPCVMHGVGMSDEYPKIYYEEDWERAGYDGEIKENMVMSIESFTGSINGGEGVKLEQMVRITHNGYELLSRFPFETDLLYEIHPEMG